jgi:CoA-transferase family III
MGETRSSAEIAARIWAGLGGDRAAPERLTITGPTHVLPSVFPVTAAASAAVGVATLAAAELWRARGRGAAEVAVDSRHAALACRSERFTQIAGRDVEDVWGPVSGDYATRDGWVRLHGVFRRHRDAALRALGARPGEADRDTVRGLVARWSSLSLEDAVLREGGAAGALRPAAAWRASAPGLELAHQPLVGLLPLGGNDGDRPPPSDIDRPLTGYRILDLTRVIAGPVAGRFLAAYGADVLRVDAPDSDDHPQVVADTTVGKRSTLLDLRQDADRHRFDALVRKADAVLCAYRPGALDDLGYDPATLARLRPGMVVGTLSAYGSAGPWGGRRGFDSIVQMTSGLADEGRVATGADRPVPLPCQLLDHASGYLLAAGVLAGLTRRCGAYLGGGWQVSVSLARTASWLDALGRGGSLDAPDPGPALPDDLAVDLQGYHGASRHIGCPGLIVGAAPHWDTGPVPLGSDDPRWL